MVRQLVRGHAMTVLATARRLDRLEALAAELPSGKVQVFGGDLADAGFRERLWTRAAGLEGGVDLFVNNAGLGDYAEFVDQSPEAIQRILDVNLVALIDLTQKAARHMKARGRGRILQISSVLGFVGVPDSAVYAASKHAVNGLVKSLRYELSGTGVIVQAACPGRTVSEFTDVARGGRGPQPPDRAVSSDHAVSGGWPRREPTERVVRGIVRGLGSRRAFIVPTWRARLIVALARWLPAPFDWAMARFRPGPRARTRAETTSRP